jgi:hypothetical protein
MESGGLQLNGVNTPIFIKTLAKNAQGLSLRAGDTVHAKVIASSHESAVLKIGDVRLQATTAMRLTPGEKVSLVVAELGPDRVVSRQLKGQDKSTATARNARAALAAQILNDSGLAGRDMDGLTAILQGTSADIGGALNDVLSALARLQDGSDSEAAYGELSLLLDEIIIDSADGDDIEAKLRSLARALAHEAGLIEFLAGKSVGADDA